MRAGRNRQQALSVAQHDSAIGLPGLLLTMLLPGFSPAQRAYSIGKSVFAHTPPWPRSPRPTTSPPSAPRRFPPLDLPRIGRPARWSHIHLLHLLQRLHLAPPWYRSPCPTAPPPSATGPSTRLASASRLLNRQRSSADDEQVATDGRHRSLRKVILWPYWLCSAAWRLDVAM